jgi:hypothetical protein
VGGICTDAALQSNAPADTPLTVHAKGADALMRSHAWSVDPVSRASTQPDFATQHVMDTLANLTHAIEVLRRKEQHDHLGAELFKPFANGDSSPIGIWTRCL